MVCQGGSKAYCVPLLVARGVPTLVLAYLLFIHARHVWRAGKGSSKLPLLITAEAFFGSLFSLVSLLPDDKITASILSSPSILFWEAGGLTIFLSWRMLNKVIKNLKKYSEKTEKRLAWFVLGVTGFLLGLLVPLSVLVVFGIIPRLVSTIVYYSEIGLAIVLLGIALLWFSVLRATLAAHLGDASHPARAVVRRMLIVIFLLVFCILFVCGSVAASSLGDRTSSLFLSMVSALFAQTMFIYAEWPRAEVKTPSHTQGGAEMAEVSRTSSRTLSTVTMPSPQLPRTPSNAGSARSAVAIVAPRKSSSNPASPTQAVQSTSRPDSQGLEAPEGPEIGHSSALSHDLEPPGSLCVLVDASLAETSPSAPPASVPDDGGRESAALDTATSHGEWQKLE